MECPICGVEISLVLVVAEAEGEVAAVARDALEATVRRLEAERYGPPIPEHHNHAPPPIPRDGWE